MSSPTQPVNRHFKVVQKLSDKTRTLTANHAEWFGLEDKVVLHGPVHVEDTKGLKADTKDEVVLFVKEGQERMLMKGGTATLPQDDDDEKPAEGSGTPIKATKPEKGKDGKNG